MRKYLVSGFRKNANEGGPHNLNAYLYDESGLRKAFAWIEGEDGNNFRKGAYPIKVDDIINIVNNEKNLWCENDYFFYVFKLV